MTYTPHVWSRHDKLDSTALNSLEQAVGAFSGTADEATAAAATANTAAANAAQSAQAAAASAALVGAPAGSAIDAYLGAPAANLAIYFNRRAGAGTYTPGDVITLGNGAFNKRTDTGTGVVFGGAPNNYENVVGGNLANVDTGNSNLAGAPTLTGSNGNWNFLLGGYDSVVNGWANSIVGFHSKIDVDANHCTFGGGSRNYATASTSYGTIGGGTQNTITGTNPTIGGGNTNQAIANGTTVAGGQTNTASGNIAAVGGGASNTASGGNSTVAGGSTNTATGTSATVGGGQFSTATGTGATVPGGRQNIAYSNYSFASGYGAHGIYPGGKAHAPGNQFSYQGDVQVFELVPRQATTTATAADLTLADGNPPVIPEMSCWQITAYVVARRDDATGEYGSWKVEFGVNRDLGNTTTLMGSPTVTALGSNSGNTWAVTGNVYSPGYARVVVTGEASKTIRWAGRMEIVQVQSKPTSAWSASTAYTVGQRFISGAGVLQCVTGGTSGTIAPTLPALGATVADGGVTWLRTA